MNEKPKLRIKYKNLVAFKEISIKNNNLEVLNTEIKSAIQRSEREKYLSGNFERRNQINEE